MGKKVRKVLSGGVIKIKKLTEKLDPLGAGLLNPVIDPIADQYLGTDMTGQKKEAAELARMQNEQEAIANQLERIRQQNANVDLGMDNVADTVTGGTANQLGANRRRRSTGSGSGVAASLGIRV